MITGDKVKDLASGGALPWGGTVPNTSGGNLWHKIARSRDITGRLKYKYNFVGTGEINKYVPNWNEEKFNTINYNSLSYMSNQGYTIDSIPAFAASPEYSLNTNSSLNGTYATPWHDTNRFNPTGWANYNSDKHPKLINHYVEWYTGNLLDSYENGTNGNYYVSKHYLPFIDEETGIVYNQGSIPAAIDDQNQKSRTPGNYAHPANIISPKFNSNEIATNIKAARYLTAYVGTNRCMSLYTMGKYTISGENTPRENIYGDSGLSATNIVTTSQLPPVGTTKTATFKWTSSITGQANNYFAYVLGMPWLNGSLMGTTSIPSYIGSNGLAATVGGTPATGGMVQIATASITPSDAATAGVGSKYISFSSAPITISGFVYVVGQPFTSTPPCLTLNYAIVNTNNSNVTSPSTFGLSGLMSWNDRYNLTYTKYDWDTDTYQEHATNAYKSERYSPTYTSSIITGLDRITSSNNYGCIYGQPSFNSLSTSTSTGSTPNVYWTQYANRGVNLNVSSSSTPHAQFFNNCIIGNSIPNPYSPPNYSGVPGSVGTFSFTFTPQITAQMVNAAGPFVDTRYFNLVCYFGLDRPTELVYRYVFVGFGTQGVSSMCNNIGLPAPTIPGSYSPGISSSSSTTISYRIVPVNADSLNTWFKLCKFKDIQSPIKNVTVNIYTNIINTTKTKIDDDFKVELEFTNYTDIFNNVKRLYNNNNTNNITIEYLNKQSNYFYSTNNTGYLKLLSPSEYQSIVADQSGTTSYIQSLNRDTDTFDYDSNSLSVVDMFYSYYNPRNTFIRCKLKVTRLPSNSNNILISKMGFSLKYDLPSYNQYGNQKYDVCFPENSHYSEQQTFGYNNFINNSILHMSVSNNNLTGIIPPYVFKFSKYDNNYYTSAEIPYSIIASTKEINIYIEGT